MFPLAPSALPLPGDCVSDMLVMLLQEAFKSIVDKFTPSHWKQDCASNLDEPPFPKVVEPAGF